MTQFFLAMFIATVTFAAFCLVMAWIRVSKNGLSKWRVDWMGLYHKVRKPPVEEFEKHWTVKK